MDQIFLFRVEVGVPGDLVTQIPVSVVVTKHDHAATTAAEHYQREK
jgi:hypothetical protein